MPPDQTMALSQRLVKGVLYGVCTGYVLLTALVVVLEPFLSLPRCPADPPEEFPNAFYPADPCASVRYWRLAGLTPQECAFGRHLAVAVVLGAIIGYERRSADRPIGIKTMCLVALAAALFTINSTFVFQVGPMEWDPARVAAAVPSGVGFLGAGLMVKDILKEKEAAVPGTTAYTIAGLTTAGSVWISAAVGIACGGGLYFEATYTCVLLVVLFRFAPRSLVGPESFDGALPQWNPPTESVQLMGSSSNKPKMRRPSSLQI